jgi:hypothetical protein
MMAILQELQTQVRMTIKPWKMSDQEPPFSPGVLIAMALIISDGTMKEGEIIDWIEQTFKYYRPSPDDTPRYASYHSDSDFDDIFAAAPFRTFKDVSASNAI